MADRPILNSFSKACVNEEPIFGTNRILTVSIDEYVGRYDDRILIVPDETRFQLAIPNRDNTFFKSSAKYSDSARQGCRKYGSCSVITNLITV